MRNTTLLILGSSILIPPPSSPLPLPQHQNNPIKSKTKLSPSHKSQSQQSSSSSPNPCPPPLLTTVRWDLNYYADLASKLAEDGRFQDLLMIADTVVSSGVNPSDFSALLNAELVSKGIVRMIGDGKLQCVIKLLKGVQKLGVGPLGLFDGSALEALARELRRLLKCGEVEQVVDLMETLAGFQFSIKDLMEPSEIIRNCVNKHKPNAAIRYACFSPQSDALFCSIILEFGKKRDLVSALTVFEASKQNLGCSNMYVYRTIIDVCGLCSDHLQSRSKYEELLVQKITPNLYVFNSLMNVNACDLIYTMHIYKQMQNLGIAADMTSYNILLKSCCLAARVDLAQDIYREVQHLESKGSLKLDVFTYSTIVKVFADARMWQMALEVKEQMLASGVTPNTVTWSSLISACANAGLVDQAFKLFEEMVLSGCVPNTQCCNVLLHACVEACQYDRAFRLFQSWKKQTVKKDRKSSHGLQVNKVLFSPTTSTYNILMKACGTDYHRAKAFMDEMKTIGLSPNHISWSTLIGVYGGSGDVKSVMQILKTMRESGIQPDVVAYTAAIKVCVENKELKSAFSQFEEMKRYHIQPNMVTYNTLLRARTRYGSLQEVQQCLAVYQDMRKAGYKPNDYYLKQLIEEWCEGIIQDNHQYQDQLNSCNISDLGGPHSLLLEKVAAHLQKGNAETLSIAVDLRGLTKVEARIVVLAVLRMIKENYTPGDLIKDDMSIILGMREIGAAAAKHKFDVRDAIIKLLRDDLGLEVLLAGPRISTEKEVKLENPFAPYPNLDKILERNGLPTQFTSLTRRPAVLLRLKVTRRSLYNWLQRRSSRSKRQAFHTKEGKIL